MAIPPRVRMLRAFARDVGGSVAVLFSIAAPAGLLAGGLAIDYARLNVARTNLQSIADGGAIAGAQSLRLANATAASVSQVVNSYVQGQSAARAVSISIATTVATSAKTVAVQLTQTTNPIFGQIFRMNSTIVAKAQAKNTGSLVPVCILALEPTKSGSVQVDVSTVNAQGCQALSDSTAADSVALSNGAHFNTARTCSSGGAISDIVSSYSPAALTDCPALTDPLATLAAPTVGPCNYNKLTISGGTQVLMPGVYCGGLQINGGSITLSAGVYVLKGGNLTISGGASVSGSDVTLYLADNGALLNIKNDSTINLSAPAVGPMAGMLIFENRANALYNQHYIESRNAPNLLGTIYLPRGILNVGRKGGGGVGGVGLGIASAWTIIVSRQLLVTDNQTLSINTNYSGTNVPPPTGLGSNTTYGAGASAQLIN